MRRHLACAGLRHQDGGVEYDTFKGAVHVVDLATIDGLTEEFDGREWLEHRTKAGLPVGWDLEWQPDRHKDQDNPVALMQFSDENTALLIRTHRTRNWLPQAVIRALKSETCAKVGVGYDGNDKMKMQNTFNLQPSNIRDLAVVARQKGLEEQGLKALCDHFGIKPKKDSRCARSDWASDKLSQAQIQYAAEDAYFAYVLDKKLEELPNIEVSDDEEPEDLIDKGVLRMKPGWSAEGIVRKHDGLYCSFCNQGPMTVPDVVAAHLGSKKHMKKMSQLHGTDEASVMPELPDEWVQQGIVLGDNLNGAQVGEYKCTVCNKVCPHKNNMEQHLVSNKHKAAIMPPSADADKKDSETAKDPFEDGMWNMPDYVQLEEALLVCTLCNSKAPTCAMMLRHLGGNGHAKKCRHHQHPEIIFLQEKGVVEEVDSGRRVVRTGFKAPSRRREKEASTVSSKTSPAQGAQGAQEKPKPLRKGWFEAVDSYSGKSYYYCRVSGETTWERPEEEEDAVEQDEEDWEEVEKEEEGLPPGWYETSTETGQLYYYTADGQVQWEPPEAVMRKVKVKRRKPAAPKPAAADKATLSDKATPVSQSERPAQQPSQQQQQMQLEQQNPASHPPADQTPQSSQSQGAHVQATANSFTPPDRVPSEGHASQPDRQQAFSVRPAAVYPQRPKQQEQQPEQQQKLAPQKEVLTPTQPALTTLPTQPQPQAQGQGQAGSHQPSAAVPVSATSSTASAPVASTAAPAPTEKSVSGSAPHLRLPPGWHLVEMGDGKYYYGDYHAQVSRRDPPEPHPYVQDDWRRDVDQGGKAFWVRETPSQLWFYEQDPDWERVRDLGGAVFWATVKFGGVRFWEKADCAAAAA